VAEDKVILTACGAKAGLVALNSSTGETVWTSECVADTGNFVSPLLIQGKDKKLIVTSTQNYYLAVDFNTGKIVWKEKGKTTYVPLPGSRQVYFTDLTDGGKMLNISDDLSSFNFKWCDSLKINQMGGAVNLGNKIFGTYNSRKGILCVDWETGKKQVFASEIRAASLLAADGMIYSYEGNGVVSLLKPTDNSIEIAGSFKVQLGTGPNLAHLSTGNGILYIRHGKTLMAYDIRQI
jgi:outer membrane protein assembly factor BamB